MYYFLENREVDAHHSVVNPSYSPATVANSPDVAISSSTILVGATQRDLLDEWGNWKRRPGKAYIFIKSVQWTEQAILMPDPGVISDSLKFGNAVSLDGDTATVGHENPDGAAIHIFARISELWVLQGMPLRADHDPNAMDCFGCSVKVKGDLVLVGSTREASYLFSRIGPDWTQQQILYSPHGSIGGWYNLLPAGTHPWDMFYGKGLGLDANTAIVGADWGIPDTITQGIVNYFDNYSVLPVSYEKKRTSRLFDALFNSIVLCLTSYCCSPSLQWLTMIIGIQMSREQSIQML